jgi:tetratricopeptide (TPR) repeat protein
MWRRQGNNKIQIYGSVKSRALTDHSVAWLFFMIPVFILLLVFSCDRASNGYPPGSGNTGTNHPSGDTSWINSTLSRISNNEIIDNDSVFLYLDSIRNLAGKAGLTVTIASALFEEGRYHYDLNHYEEAKDCFERAIAAAKEAKDTLTWARSLQILGSVALSTGDDHLCLKLNYESLPLFEKIGYNDGIARVYNILGLYKSGQKEYDSAISYFNKAMEINRQIANQTGLMHNRGNLAYLYEKTGKFTVADSIYHLLEYELIKDGDSLNLPVVYADLASVSKKMGKLEVSRAYLIKAVNISELTKDTANMGGNYGDLGEAYYNSSQFDSAGFFLRKSYICSGAVKDYEIQCQALKFLIKIDSINFNFKPAITKYEKLLALKDSVFSIKYRNHLKASELDYENQKKNHLIEYQNLQLKSVKKNNRLFLSLFIISALTCTLALISIFLLFKNIRKKRELFRNEILIRDLEIQNAKKSEEIQALRIKSIEEEMKIKEREQVSHALALEQKNELLSLINNKINAAMEDTGILHIQELNGLVSSIRIQISDSTENDLFNQKFNKVHSAFYSNLTKAHPDLTKSELKFCAYLKLNLTSHQISAIMNVTSEAIRKNRHRIRKKLRLEKEDSLENYLSTF